MYYSALYKHDTTSGEGFHVSLFISGCVHHCKGCFQPQTWNFKFGKLFTDDTIEEIIEALEPHYITSICLLGGDPLENAADPMLEKLLIRIRSEFGNSKDIWVWSGYEYSEIINDPVRQRIIQYCNVLVDGRFIAELKNLNLPHRGSSNQCVIDIQKSLQQDRVVLYEH